jgi:uncharacterized SAM-binding protein YcdF (DUF218 family)
MKLSEVLVVLGSPNSPEGQLSEIARSRLDCVADLYDENKRILCTGGWGAHFNVAPKAHAIYAKEYLIKKGIPEQSFLEVAISSNTVEDAVKSKAILSRLDRPRISIITSDFHLDRVRLIFNEILKGFEIQFIGVKSGFLNKEELNSLTSHEQTAIQSIIRNGLYY